MKKYDVIIVGGGPSGAAAGMILKQNEISFCIIDKHKFPREKLCGGGLTPKSVVLLKKMGFDLNSINIKKVHNTILYSKKIAQLIELDNDIVMIDRLEFDYHNLKTVTKNIFEEENVLKINQNILITDKDQYEFKYVIFADGVNGFSRKFIQKRKFGFCVEYNAPIVSKKNVLDFEAVKNGYGWIFPKKNHTTIGIGTCYYKKINYPSVLEAFAQKYHYEIDRKQIKGYHIPIFSKKIYQKSVINNKYILVGDAASLVDQISGEGIYYALASGMEAAKSIVSCLNNDQDLKKTYFQNTKYLVKSLMKKKFLSKLLYSKGGPIFIKIGLKNKAILKRLKRIYG